MKQKRETKLREVSTKTKHHTPSLELPPPPDWSIFRRSGRILDSERLAVAAVQEGHPELQHYSNAALVEVYRSHKRKHLHEIPTRQD